MDAQVTVRCAEGLRVLRWAGELDLVVVELLRDSVAWALHGVVEKTAVEAIVVELDEVTFLDCAALGVLICLAERCRERGVPFVVVRPSAVVQRLIFLLELAAALPVLTTSADALTADAVIAEVLPRSTP